MGTILSATSLDGLGHSFSVATRKFGINAFAFGLMPTSDELGALPLVRWRNWIEFYAVNGFAQHDIVFDEMRRTREPFTWNELKRRRPGEGLRVFEACSGFGWNDGLTVPIDEPHLRHGFVSLAAPSLSLDSSDRAEITQLVVATYTKVQALVVDPESVPQRLSAREREALGLVATGLNDAEIAEAMSISTTTAHAHVERAKRRLSARTRAQAVALAMTAGII